MTMSHDYNGSTQLHVCAHLSLFWSYPSMIKFDQILLNFNFVQVLASVLTRSFSGAICFLSTPEHHTNITPPLVHISWA